jgi:hypothetical protein
MAAGNTYTKIASTTVSGGSTNSVSFSSFSGYSDLILIIDGSVGSNCGLQMRFNSDSGSNYSFTRMTGDGSTASSDRSSNATFMELGYYLSTARNMNIIHIMNYSNTTTYKTVLNRANAQTANIGAQAYVELWRSTSAITSLAVTASGNYSSGSTFNLYGIAAA